MLFSKEEIRGFTRAFFENTCAALDTENGMKYYLRDTFKNGIVPNLDIDALDRITVDLKHRYMFDTKHKISRWDMVQIPETLMNTYVDRILARVVVHRPCQVEVEARRQAWAK